MSGLKSILNTKWLTIGIGLKRWIVSGIVGFLIVAVGVALFITRTVSSAQEATWPQIVFVLSGGIVVSALSVLRLWGNLLAPYRGRQSGPLVDAVYSHTRRQRGVRFVAIGGGTGLPSVLRGLKPFTNNITAVVTVADDGGSSGRLRRELGVLPPGDIRNNIVALADDENLMTQLFQYRFHEGDLSGHAFGNLFIAALAGVSGGLEGALPEVERVLNIQGRVLPSTLADVQLEATIRPTSGTETVLIRGESNISSFDGEIERIRLSPPDVSAYQASIRAIIEADAIVIGPGSLFTSILPNLIVEEIADALRATAAHKIYVCNVATQPGETDNFNVADHVLALEMHIGRGMFQAVLANDATPSLNAGENTLYVPPAPTGHEILQRYDVHYTDLTNHERPWRHDPQKLALALLRIIGNEKAGQTNFKPVA